MPPSGAEPTINDFGGFSEESQTIKALQEESLPANEIFKSLVETPQKIVETDTEENFAAEVYKVLIEKLIAATPDMEEVIAPVKLITSRASEYSPKNVYALMTEPDFLEEGDRAKMLVVTDNAVYVVEDRHRHGQEGAAALTAFASVHDDLDKLNSFLETGRIVADRYQILNGTYYMTHLEQIQPRRLNMTEGSGDNQEFQIMMDRLTKAQTKNNEANAKPANLKW